MGPCAGSGSRPMVPSLFILGEQLRAMSSSASSRHSDTKAIRCGCCSSTVSHRRMRSALSIVGSIRNSAPTRCLHFGTHGALEFMPGKQAGHVRGNCWPDRLIGDLPNFYLYASNNPSEGMIAKRRAGAALISYLTPPVAHAGIVSRPAGPEGVPGSLARDLGLMRMHGQSAAIWRRWCKRRLRQWTLPRRSRPGIDVPAPMDKQLSAALLELEYTLIPHGLHVVGEPTGHGEQRVAEMLDAAGVADPADRRETPWMICWPWITRFRQSCMHWMAAISVRHPVATCCARRTCYRPGVTCMVSIRFVSPALLPCRDGALPSRAVAGTTQECRAATACRKRWRWCCGAPTT